jgi:hypothetical protein
MSAETSTAYWLKLGLPAPAARSIGKYGIQNLEDLKRRPRRTILAVRGVGENTLRRLEELLSTKFPRRRGSVWRRYGFNPKTIRALERAGIASLSDLHQVSREEFLSQPGLAVQSLRRCEALIGRPLPSSFDAWLNRGLRRWAAWRLSLSRIHTLEDARNLSEHELVDLGLTRSELTTLGLDRNTERR